MTRSAPSHDLHRLDRSFLRLRRFFETPPVVDDGGRRLEPSTLLVLDAVLQHEEGPVDPESVAATSPGTPDPAAVVDARDGEGATVREVAQRLDVTHSTASRLVARAVEAGVVARHGSATDRRRSVLVATPEGRAVHERALEYRFARLEHLLDGWSDADRGSFAAALERFARAARRAPR